MKVVAISWRSCVGKEVVLVTQLYVAAFLVAVVLFAVRKRPKRRQRQKDVLDTLAAIVDNVITQRIVSRLPQLTGKR